MKSYPSNRKSRRLQQLRGHSSVVAFDSKTLAFQECHSTRKMEEWREVMLCFSAEWRVQRAESRLQSFLVTSQSFHVKKKWTWERSSASWCSADPDLFLCPCDGFLLIFPELKGYLSFFYSSKKVKERLIWSLFFPILNSFYSDEHLSIIFQPWKTKLPKRALETHEAQEELQKIFDAFYTYWRPCSSLVRH